MTADSQQVLLMQIFQAQRRSLIGTLYRIVGCPHTAEDLAQDAYLRVNLAAADRTVNHLQGFLYQTARNLAVDHVRRERIRQRLMSDDAGDDAISNIAAPAPTPETAVMDKERLRRIADVLSQVPERWRQSLFLSRIEGMTYSEIARHLCVSENTVYNDIRAAMARCLASLDEDALD